MDHAMDYLSDYSSFDKDNYIDEWRSGKYKKISDCPSYWAVKAYCDALNILSKYYYGDAATLVSPRSIISNYKLRYDKW